VPSDVMHLILPIRRSVLSLSLGATLVGCASEATAPGTAAAASRVTPLVYEDRWCSPATFARVADSTGDTTRAHWVCERPGGWVQMPTGYWVSDSSAHGAQ
jgi:hypothetical protein